jgi:NAD(P)-dependent dehydrogenase (short-subunit alcohol dehydrogenase family)
VAEGRKAFDEMHPIGHVGEPDDIAYAARYLASDESKFVTGTQLIVDGDYGPITKDDRGRHENLVAEDRLSRRSSRDI